MRLKNILLKGFIYCIWLLLIVIGIMDLFDQPYRSIIWFGFLFLLIFIYKAAKNLPDYIHLLLCLFTISIVIGELIFDLYYAFDFYDKILHFLVAIIICISIFHLAKQKIKNKKMLVMFCILAAIILSVCWEIIEYGFDKNIRGIMQAVYLDQKNHFFGVTERREIINSMKDAIADLFFNVLGSLSFGLGYILIKKNKQITNYFIH